MGVCDRNSAVAECAILLQHDTVTVTWGSISTYATMRIVMQFSGTVSVGRRIWVRSVRAASPPPEHTNWRTHAQGGEETGLAENVEAVLQGSIEHTVLYRPLYRLSVH